MEVLIISDQELTYNPETGLKFRRVYTKEGVHPYDRVKWTLSDVEVASAKGEVIFSQKQVEFPEDWAQNSVQIVTSKYFHGKMDTPERETSLKQLIDRVVKTIATWGREGGYFATAEDARIFEEELTDIVLHQRMAFNSPVWFNMGTTDRPQGSACFINSVEDTMDSILDLAKTEGMIFKYGSGSGVNLSGLRAKGELLSTGGTASGPISFMKGYDAFAGSIKSGGKTRRAAKMVLLNDDHPDIMDFIISKENEEKKAWALIDAGYDGSFTGEAYSSVFFQNANHSVRVSDTFMNAVLDDKFWETKAVTSGETMGRYKARYMLERISQATHLCGDPGLQYRTTINRWHTCKNTGPINASNPCSEFVFLDNTSCNLASINLMKYRNADGSFMLEEFNHTVELTITAQEIIVGRASYPTPQIEENSFNYRPLGLGYTNIGAYLMSVGLAYDSEEGRNFAAAVSSAMSGHAYLQSVRMAVNQSPFAGYDDNRDPMLEVMQMHGNAAKELKRAGVDDHLYEFATSIWDEVINSGWESGFRNAQISVLAPTGTISFMMAADTTGIEPEVALVKYKKLVGGGYMKIVNQTIPMALERLGYSKQDVDKIVKYIDTKGSVEGCEELKVEHLPIFDVSIPPSNSKRSIHHMGHIRMMAAVQPFISGAISKTVNMPENVSVQEISDAYIEAWKLGVKAIAIYRNNSKRLQPLVTKDESKEEDPKVEKVVVQGPVRRRLDPTRNSKIHKFEVDNHEGYIIVGMYNDGKPGEVFIKMSKQGSTLGGVMDSLAVLISMSLQYGVPLRVLVNKFIHTKFEPSGMTGNPSIPIASSVIDYIFRWLGLEFLKEDERPGLKDYAAGEEEDPIVDVQETVRANGEDVFLGDNKICDQCGAIAVRSGSCYACPECGTTSGCS